MEGPRPTPRAALKLAMKAAVPEVASAVVQLAEAVSMSVAADLLRTADGALLTQQLEEKLSSQEHYAACVGAPLLSTLPPRLLKTCRLRRRMLAKVYRELMILGFISFGVVVWTPTSWRKKWCWSAS